jgi:hypothetical protein
MDKLLNLHAEDVEILSETSISINLPSRKTNQFGGKNPCCSLLLKADALGGTKPFVLYELGPDEKHLCPLRTLGSWVVASDSDSGYIFHSVNTMDQVSVNNSPIVRLLTTSKYYDYLVNVVDN